MALSGYQNKSFHIQHSLLEYLFQLPLNKKILLLTSTMVLDKRSSFSVNWSFVGYVRLKVVLRAELSCMLLMLFLCYFFLQILYFCFVVNILSHSPNMNIINFILGISDFNLWTSASRSVFSGCASSSVFF